jgi:hypothetical protein
MLAGVIYFWRARKGESAVGRTVEDLDYLHPLANKDQDTP